MMTFDQPEALRSHLRKLRQQNLCIALVPTMGNLHEGHLALVDIARQHAHIVVVSIFVNPMQFDRPDDLTRYPRTLEADQQQLSDRQADILFAPEVDTIYPSGVQRQTLVYVPELSDVSEGARRPGHFQGVSTVVSKLFNFVQPDVACFGQKDFQQLAIIRKMVADMGYGIRIIGVPTVRAGDNLALSSRNGYLSAEQRYQAPLLYQVMRSIAQAMSAGNTDYPRLIAQAEQQLTDAGWRPNGIAICDSQTLMPLTADSQQAVILMAAWLGNARLIDNQLVELT